MPSYAAFIGHHPAISIAELSAVIPHFTIQQILGKQVVVFESSADLSPKDLNLLGGTIAIARALDQPITNVSEVPKALARVVEGVKGKVVFGLRAHGIAPKVLADTYRSSKQYLKKQGRPVRYVGSETVPAPSVVLHTEDMLSGKRGAEIVLLQMEDQLWAGRTIAAQDVDAYTKRDIRKPVRDTTVGLLPPKLAQILLNLGLWAARKAHDDLPEQLTVLDPFCGTGVIPLECLLRGWSVLASDLSQKAVNGCTKNIEWMRKEEKIAKSEVPATVWKQDAARPFDFAGGNPFKVKQLPHMVVTETSLGPPLTSRPPLKDVQKLKTENEKLQIAFLGNIAKSLPGVPIVCTWPVWYYSKGPIHLERVLDAAQELGFDVLLPPGVQWQSDRPTLTYRRPDQFVGREIVILRPTRQRTTVSVKHEEKKDEKPTSPRAKPAPTPKPLKKTMPKRAPASAKKRR